MNTISDFDKRFQIGRDGMTWSESVIRRRRALANSDTDSTEAKESTAPQPPPESLLPKPPQPQSPVKKCSSCSCRKSNPSIKKRHGSSHSIEERAIEKKGRDINLQQVEAKLYNAELEKAMHTERLERIQERLHRAAQLLEAKVLFVQSLDLKARALARLTQLVGNFAYKDLMPTENLAQSLDRISWDGNLLERLSEVQGVAMSAAEAPEQLYQLLDDFRDKRKDYQTASHTFSQFLRTSSRVSASQLRKFESQYDSIRSSYEYSRQILETEVPKLINERHNVLEHCFSKLVPVQKKLIEQDKDFLILSEEISKSLQEPSTKNPCRHVSEDKYSSQLHSNKPSRQK